MTGAPEVGPLFQAFADEAEREAERYSGILYHLSIWCLLRIITDRLKPVSLSMPCCLLALQQKLDSEGSAEYNFL